MSNTTGSLFTRSPTWQYGAMKKYKESNILRKGFKKIKISLLFPIIFMIISFRNAQTDKFDGKVIINYPSVPTVQIGCIGYLPEHNPLYPEMYVKEYLEFSGGIYKVSNLRSRVNLFYLFFE